MKTLHFSRNVNLNYNNVLQMSSANYYQKQEITHKR